MVVLTPIARVVAAKLPRVSGSTPSTSSTPSSPSSLVIAQRGLWDPDYCGAGPNEGWPLKLWVNAIPVGSDEDALEEEFVTIQNRDPVNAMDVSGWWVRDSGLRRYVFAPGTVLAGAQAITVRVGAGTDNLFDPQGDIRASMIYPCRTVCKDPL